MLRKNGFSIEQVRAVTSDYHSAGLDPAEVEMMDYAQKVALCAYEVSASSARRCTRWAPSLTNRMRTWPKRSGMCCRQRPKREFARDGRESRL